MNDINNYLEIFNKCQRDNLPYYSTYECENEKFIIILKYAYTNFEMKILSSRLSNHIEECYNSLGPFDCFDLLREYIESNKVAH